MKIIRDNIEELMEKTGCTQEKMNAAYLERGTRFVKYSDPPLNTFMDRWHFFDEAEEKIRKVTGASLECILFSKYYWALQFKKRHQELYGYDAGLDQQCDFIFEEILNRLDLDEINWDVLQAIDEDRYD